MRFNAASSVHEVLHCEDRLSVNTYDRDNRFRTMLFVVVICESNLILFFFAKILKKNN